MHIEKPQYRGEDNIVVCVYVLRRQDGRKWSGTFWLRIGPSGRIL